MKLLFLISIISLLGIDFLCAEDPGSLFTKHWKTKDENIPFPVKARNILFTVAWRKNDSIHVQSPPEAKIKPCEIPIDLGKGNEVNKRLWGQALGNGKIVVHTEFWNNGDFVSNIYVIIDPFECNAKKLVIPIQGLYSYMLMITYQDTFDILSPHHRYTEDAPFPTRYNDKGERVGIPYQVDPKVSLLGRNCLTTIKYQDSSEGYLVATTKENVTSVSVVNSKFQLVKKANRTGFLESCSTEYGKISVCYTIDGQIFCEFLTPDLETKMKVPLVKPKNGRIRSVYISNLADGASVILTQYNFNEKNDTAKIYMQRIKKDGTSDEAVEVYEYNDADYFPIGMGMDNGEFCLVSIEKERPNTGLSYPAIIDARCTAATK